MVNFHLVRRYKDFDWRGSDEYYDAVIRAYFKKLVKNPRSHVFVSMASTCLKARRVKMAHDVLKRGMEHHPSLKSARICLARVNMARKKYEEAEGILKSLLDEDRDNLLARRLLAEISVKMKRPEKGLEYLEEIRKMEPGRKVAGILFKLGKELEPSLEGVSPVITVVEEAPAPAEEGGNVVIGTLEKWLDNASRMSERGVKR